MKFINFSDQRLRIILLAALFSLVLIVTYNGYREYYKGYAHIVSHFSSNYVDAKEPPKVLRRSIKETIPVAILVFSVLFWQVYSLSGKEFRVTFWCCAKVVFFTACVLNLSFTHRHEALLVLNSSFFVFLVLIKAVEKLFLPLLEERVLLSDYTETYLQRYLFLRNLNFKHTIHFIVAVKLVMVLFFAWHCACVNRNYNFFETFYGYAGGQNAYKYPPAYPPLVLANLMDLSGSPEAVNHPYYCATNLDLSLLLNTIMAKIGFGKSSYMAVHLLTGICRVLVLYLYYFVFMSLTMSPAISTTAILLLATDYLFFDVPLFNAIRGNDFTIVGAFLFGLFSYQKRGEREFYLNPYFYICVVALFLGNYSGYWMPFVLFFFGALSIVFRFLNIRLQDFILIFLFGSGLPYVYKTVLLVSLVGLYNTLTINQIVMATKMFLPGSGFDFELGLIYSFYDANRLICWPCYPVEDINAAIAQYIWGIKATFRILRQYIDYGTLFSVLILFPLIISGTLITRNRLSEEQKRIFLYAIAIILTLLLTWVFFPGNYYFLVLLNPYLIMPGVCLILSYVIIYGIRNLNNAYSGVKILIVLFVLMIVYCRASNSLYHWQLLPIKEDMTPKVLQGFPDTPIATANVNNYPIYPAFTKNYCLYINESDFNEPPPFDVGHSFIVSARDQFEVRKYCYPKLIVLYTNGFDRFSDLATGSEVYNILTKRQIGKKLRSLVKKKKDTDEAYGKLTKKQIDKSISLFNKMVLSRVSEDRILYNDGNLVVLRTKPVDRDKELIYQKLDGITHSVLDKYLRDGFTIEKLRPILDDLYKELFKEDATPIDESKFPNYVRLKNWVERLQVRTESDDLPFEALYPIYLEIRTYEQDILAPQKAAKFLSGISYIDGYIMTLASLLAQLPTTRLWDARAFDRLFNDWYSTLPLTLKETAMRMNYYNVRSKGKFDPLRLRLTKEILQTHEKNKVCPK